MCKNAFGREEGIPTKQTQFCNILQYYCNINLTTMNICDYLCNIYILQHLQNIQKYCKLYAIVASPQFRNTQAFQQP